MSSCPYCGQYLHDVQHRSENACDELRKIIEGKGLTPAEAARRMGISYHTIIRWLLGTSKPRTVYLRLLLETLKDFKENQK